MNVWIDIEIENSIDEPTVMVSVYDYDARDTASDVRWAVMLRHIRDARPHIYHRVFAEQYPPGTLLQAKTIIAGDGHPSVSIDPLTEPPTPV